MLAPIRFVRMNADARIDGNPPTCAPIVTNCLLGPFGNVRSHLPVMRNKNPWASVEPQTVAK